MLNRIFYNTLKRRIESESYESKEAMQSLINDYHAKKRITDTQKAELERLLYLTDNKGEQ